MRLYDDITSDGSKPRVRFNWRSSREQPADVPGLELVFDGFCSFAGGAAGLMDNAKFTKCCIDSGLIIKTYNQSFTSADADIIFSKVKAPGERRLIYEDFLWAVDLMAETKGQGLTLVHFSSQLEPCLT